MRALWEAGLMDDVRFCYAKDFSRIDAVWQFADSMCGHAGVTHGGVSSLAIDCTFGQLFYNYAVFEGLRPGFTVNLNVNFKAPIPTSKPFLISAEITRVEGRKVYMKAVVRDGLKGVVYSDATAVFVMPKN